MSASTLHGVIPPMITPFDAQGNFVPAAMAEAAEFLIQAGVHGIVAGGSTGEGHTFERDDYARMIEAASKAIRGRVPFVAGLIATRRVGRAVTGVLLVVEGLIALVGALWFGLGADDRADVLRLVSDKAGVDVQADLAVRPWWLVVAVGGLLVVVVGVLAVLRGGTWPVMGRRYERTEGEAPASAAAGSASAWDQLDQGVDPTVDTSAADPSPTTPGPTRSAPGGPGAGMMAPTDAPEDTP